mgnify:CR=1 FL=1
MSYKYSSWSNETKIERSEKKNVNTIEENINNEIKLLKKKNHREESIIKMANRDMIIQRGVNPFLSGNNYIQDIINQEKYLRQNNLNDD